MRVLVAGLLCALSAFAVSGLQVSPLHAHLDKQLRIWQKRLGLGDWTLSVHFVRKSVLDEDTWGYAEWDSETKTGAINVVDPQDYNLKRAELKRDMECTIVHELVHIQVSPLDNGETGAQEQVVNHITTALLNRACPN